MRIIFRWPTHVLFLLSIPLILSCASTVPPPSPIDTESAALGLSLKLREGPLHLTSKTAEVVLFVRLEEGEDLESVTTKKVLIPSTFTDGEYAYLLNVAPGRYAAVAAIYGEDVEPLKIPVASANIGSNVRVGFNLDLFGGETIYRSYFSRELIGETVTTVEPASLAFMGRFVADQSIRFGDGDEAQVHFLRALEGEDVDRSGFFSDALSKDRAFRLSPHESENDRKAEIEFCKKAMKHLKGTSWVQMVERLMAEE